MSAEEVEKIAIRDFKLANSNSRLPLNFNLDLLRLIRAPKKLTAKDKAKLKKAERANKKKEE